VEEYSRSSSGPPERGSGGPSVASPSKVTLTTKGHSHALVSPPIKETPKRSTEWTHSRVQNLRYLQRPSHGQGTGHEGRDGVTAIAAMSRD